MMLQIIHGLTTWQFWIGVVAGYFGRRTWCVLRARWLDKHRPLPDGRKHDSGGINWRSAGMILALIAVCWSLYKVQMTADTTVQIISDARTFSAEVKDCQKQFNTALQARAAITTENDQLSQDQRKALADWLHYLLFPPPHIANLSRDDPVYKQWAIDLTTYYYGIIADSQKQQDENNRERAAHPLPEPTCGKG